MSDSQVLAILQRSAESLPTARAKSNNKQQTDMACVGGAGGFSGMAGGGLTGGRRRGMGMTGGMTRKQMLRQRAGGALMRGGKGKPFFYLPFGNAKLVPRGKKSTRVHYLSRMEPNRDVYINGKWYNGTGRMRPPPTQRQTEYRQHVSRYFAAHKGQDSAPNLMRMAADAWNGVPAGY